MSHTHTHLVYGSEHLRATGHPGHGLDEDVQVLLQPLDDLHRLVVILTERDEGLGGGGGGDKLYPIQLRRGGVSFTVHNWGVGCRALLE